MVNFSSLQDLKALLSYQACQMFMLYMYLKSFMLCFVFQRQWPSQCPFLKTRYIQAQSCNQNNDKVKVIEISTIESLQNEQKSSWPCALTRPVPELLSIPCLWLWRKFCTVKRFVNFHLHWFFLLSSCPNFRPLVSEDDQPGVRSGLLVHLACKTCYLGLFMSCCT